MSEPEAVELVARARDAAVRGEWQRALELFTEADVRGSVSGADLPVLADVAYAAGRLDVTIDAWERAHAQSLRAGDRLAAAGAAVRVAMHLLFDTALMAPVRGWISRSERLLEGYDATPVHAWLAVVRNYERMLSGDFDSARQWARQAIELGTEFAPAAAAIGRVAEARSLILSGDVAHGLALLNEAGVAALSGELEPLFTGIVYCEVVCALQALAQYDLAEQWTAAMEQWRRGQPVGSIHGRCRVHRAEILRLRGSCIEAEREAVLACDELRPYLRREFGWPLTELGRIRLRRGDIAGAEEAFAAAQDRGWDPQPGVALVHLAKGEITRAVESIRDALARSVYVPSKELPPNTELRRAPLLEAQVEIEITGGNLVEARAAAGELSRIAERFGSKALVAGAALARGRVRLTEGDTEAARREFAEAADLWSEIGAPYEMVLSRLGLAEVYRATGDDMRATMELGAAESALERIGAIVYTGDAARPLGSRSGQEQRAQDPGAADNVFRREGDYWSIAFQGRVVRLRDVKGLHYLALLLAHPGREFHVIDMVAGGRTSVTDATDFAPPGITTNAAGNAGELLDAEAKAAYRRRLAEIDEDIEQAEELGDDHRAAQAQAERDFLVRELVRAVGLGGRDRRAGSTSERARASVTRAVRNAMTRVEDHHPELGEHLARTIRTGTCCTYRPDAAMAVSWRMR